MSNMSKIYDSIIEVANEEFDRVFKVDMSQKFNDFQTLPAEIIKNYATLVSASALIHYHQFLQEKLLEHGIDIGSL